ncbi:AraC family transcriptional regulator [Runella sp. SP2]|uniref:AraC family transcriptional regulator n=1 Tax=Runella sp. SP2 TaxID=2268026 RepID=UPI000F086371|nr:AraC family transcriptional regulator [Runella sp. SP2]AYQ33555.1 AraC family transcriptional regulator [Runella sp. SP2]
MKTEYENITPDRGSSFKVLHWRSHEDRFFWHQHPEYEIVYIHKGSGKRHIGQHLSHFEEGELMFIGPNVPHLNFGYGANYEHEEIVVQLRDTFLGESFLQSPELQDINRLFELSKKGLNFYGETRQEVANLMLTLPQLSHFERLIQLLIILQKLATSKEYNLLKINGISYEHSHREEARIRQIYGYVEQHYQREIDVQTVADLANLTVPSFCRYFKKITQMTFTDFVNEYRIKQASKLLVQNQSVTDACYSSGFNNLSHFTKTFKAVTGKTPREYKKANDLL